MLYLSYRCRDLQKDAVLYPSSIIWQLKSIIKKPGKDNETDIIETPLLSYSKEFLKTHNDSELFQNYSNTDRRVIYSLVKDKLHIDEKTLNGYIGNTFTMPNTIRPTAPSGSVIDAKDLSVRRPIFEDIMQVIGGGEAHAGSDAKKR